VRASRDEVQQEALARAASGQSLGNWPAIVAGFLAKGIPEADIRPRENVFTYHAWRALGRQVRRGEHGVKVVTFITTAAGDAPADDAASGAADAGTGSPAKRRGGRRPWTATVFHISQTDPIGDPAPRFAPAGQTCPA
jgi:hypothetical protein